jgi:hypothetical protein
VTDEVGTQVKEAAVRTGLVVNKNKKEKIYEN